VGRALGAIPTSAQSPCASRLQHQPLSVLSPDPVPPQCKRSRGHVIGHMPQHMQQHQQVHSTATSTAIHTGAASSHTAQENRKAGSTNVAEERGNRKTLQRYFQAATHPRSEAAPGAVPPSPPASRAAACAGKGCTPPRGDTWDCARCTFTNQRSRYLLLENACCEMCGTGSAWRPGGQLGGGRERTLQDLGGASSNMERTNEVEETPQDALDAGRARDDGAGWQSQDTQANGDGLSIRAFF
jgi:hypothetical protein